MKFQHLRAITSKNHPFCRRHARKKVDFFTFLLFYKQNALIYARNFFNAAKMYTYSPEKLACPPPQNFGTLKIYPLFPSKRAILSLLEHEITKFSRAFARKPKKTGHLSQARAKKGRFFYFFAVLQTKCTHIS